jgi:hypothetical protein
MAEQDDKVSRTGYCIHNAHDIAFHPLRSRHAEQQIVDTWPCTVCRECHDCRSSWGISLENE